MENERSLLRSGIGFLILVVSAGVAIGQGGTGRVLNPPTPRRPTVMRRTPPIRPIDQGVLKIIALPMTAEAKQLRARGDSRAPTDGDVARIRVVMDESGNVVASQAVNGHPALLDSALTDSRQERFTPATQDGRPVNSVGVIDYVFSDLPWLGILKTVNLPMTAEAKQLQARGDPRAPVDGTTVRIRVTLDERGRVIATAPADGFAPPAVINAALSDASQQQFAASVRGRRQIKYIGWIVYVFTDRPR